MLKFIRSSVLGLFSLVALSSTAFAGIVHVNVNGMVCSFCAQGIEKKFMENAGVEKVTVSLTEKRVTLVEKSGAKIEDAVIKNILEKAGYSVQKIER